MADWPAIADLANELRTTSVHILRFTRQHGWNLNRAAAKVSPGQEQTIRRAVKDGRIPSRLERSRPPQRATQRPAGVRPEHSEERRVPLRKVPRYGVCTCCNLGFGYSSSDAVRDICPHCGPHYPQPGDWPGRRAARNEEHAKRYGEFLESFRAKNNEIEAEKNRAFESRNKWRALLIEVALSHEPDESGACVCGGGRFPCLTRRQITYQNRGIAKEIERVEGLPDAQRERFLYPNLEREEEKREYDRWLDELDTWFDEQHRTDVDAGMERQHAAGAAPSRMGQDPQVGA